MDKAMRSDINKIFADEVNNGKDPREDGCLCQSCGERYKVDLMIPDKLWDAIYPDKNGGELLCGVCIMKKVEMLDNFGCIFFMRDHPALV